ncbi:MAG: PhzF family phenazine biosynthesis protein [Bacillota bacterium]
MKIPIYQVDAFANEQFKGNPAAVCPLDSWLSDSLMQNIAAENNLSETAFFIKDKDEYKLRWFTPKGEIDLCGHATLASAYVIFEYFDKNKSEIVFKTKSGKLKVLKENNLIKMTFPKREGKKCKAPKALVKGLGKKPKEVYKSRDYMAVFENKKDIENLDLNMEELKKLDDFVIVTAPGETCDFVSRFFAPTIGIDEDPVTGSAHCTLIPYWRNRLDKNNFKALQLSKRGGKLICNYLGDKIQISGKAVTYLKGDIFINEKKDKNTKI